MDEQNPRKRKTPSSPHLDEGGHLSSSTSKHHLPLPSPTSTLPLLPEFPPSAATPITIDDQLSSPHNSSDNAENDTIDHNTSLSPSTSEPPPLLPSSTLPLLPETPPPSATPTTGDQPNSSHSSDPIDPPYPWATNRRATVHSFDYLIKNGINKIEGEVECKKCNNKYKRAFDLEEKLKKIAEFMNSFSPKDISRERALLDWLTPDMGGGGGCESCGKKGRLKPVIPRIESGQEINWLFLFLGQMLMFCGMDHLKYFCIHTKVPRLGSEERLIYLAYLGLCKQLHPTSPAFDP